MEHCKNDETSPLHASCTRWPPDAGFDIEQTHAPEVDSRLGSAVRRHAPEEIDGID